MNKGGSKAQIIPKGRDIAQNSPLKRFFDNSPKQPIIIVNIEGCILNGDREIPNTSCVLNMIQKEFGIEIKYLGTSSTKEMKMIRKKIRGYNFPFGEIFLIRKNSFEYTHIHTTLTNLNDNYNVKLVITTDVEISRYSKKLDLDVIVMKYNAEWNKIKRKEILKALGSS